jgi:hypothetical protein
MANFAIKLKDDRWLSFYQEPYGSYDEDVGMDTCEVALMGGEQMIGEPVRFSDAEELRDIIVSVLDGDDSLFIQQYLMVFEDPDNDNQSVNQT